MVITDRRMRCLIHRDSWTTRTPQRAAQAAADHARDWEETPAEAARYDRYHFDRDED